MRNAAIAYVGICLAGIGWLPHDSGLRVFALLTGLLAFAWLVVGRQGSGS